MRMMDWAVTILLVATPCYAYDGVVSTAGANEVVITLDDVWAVSGFGAHFSTGIANGDGAFHAECYMNTDSSNIFVYCYDGQQDVNNPSNSFIMAVGAQAYLKRVVFKITKRGVEVSTSSYSYIPYTTEKHLFHGTWRAPLRETTGFWRPGTNAIYYQANCLLTGCESRGGGHPGAGYQIISVEVY